MDLEEIQRLRRLRQERKHKPADPPQPEPRPGKKAEPDLLKSAVQYHSERIRPSVPTAAPTRPPTRTTFVASRTSTVTAVSRPEEEDTVNDLFEPEEERWAMSSFISESVQYSSNSSLLVSTAADVPLSDSNRGFKLLAKMGWKQGEGMGRNQQGIKEPIQFQVNDSQLGLGKASQYEAVISDTVIETVVKRRRLEEDAEVTERKRHELEKREEREVEKREELKEFYCQWCLKQYKNVGEWQAHLQSYGHTHTRNMKELREKDAKRRNAQAGSVEEKRKKESRREERALAKRMKAAGIKRKKTIDDMSTNQPIRVSGEASGWGAVEDDPKPAPQQRGGWGAAEDDPKPAPQQRGGWGAVEDDPKPAPQQRGGWGAVEDDPKPAPQQ